MTPAGSRQVRRGIVTVTIGEALSADDLLGPDHDVRAATDRLMFAIRRLGDLPYIDEYARR